MLRPQASTGHSPRCFGIDTSHYGHCAIFLKVDLQPAASELSFAESSAPGSDRPDRSFLKPT
jgi:hypothetical protein